MPVKSLDDVPQSLFEFPADANPSRQNLSILELKPNLVQSDPGTI
jgi:hypothetical protein